MNSSHRRSGSRSTVALVVGLALAAGLTACGSDGDDDTATDPAGSTSPSQTPSESPTETPSETSAPPDEGSGSRSTIPATGTAGVTEVTLISATEGGGSASTLAFALDTDQAVADFAGQFEGSFVDTVGTTASEVAQQGATTYGATAAVGCEPPRSVAVEAGEAGFEVIPKLPKSNIQCLAPMTYVVLFAVPDA